MGVGGWERSLTVEPGGEPLWERCPPPLVHRHLQQGEAALPREEKSPLLEFVYIRRKTHRGWKHLVLG